MGDRIGHGGVRDSDNWRRAAGSASRQAKAPKSVVGHAAARHTNKGREAGFVVVTYASGPHTKAEKRRGTRRGTKKMVVKGTKPKDEPIMYSFSLFFFILQFNYGRRRADRRFWRCCRARVGPDRSGASGGRGCRQFTGLYCSKGCWWILSTAKLTGIHGQGSLEGRETGRRLGWQLGVEVV